MFSRADYRSKIQTLLVVDFLSSIILVPKRIIFISS